MNLHNTVIPKAFKKSKPKPKSGTNKGKMMYLKAIKDNKKPGGY